MAIITLPEHCGHRSVINALDEQGLFVEYPEKIAIHLPDSSFVYPLRNISYARRVGRQQRGTYSCQDLVGDHPVPANRNVEFEGETPAEGLNLVDQTGKPHFIEPWLTRRRCQKCQHEETYILDRYMRDGAIMFKSLEYGHESEADDLRENLTAIGIELPKV